MHRGKRLVTGIVLISGLRWIAGASTGAQPVNAQPYSGGTNPTIVVIRGSDPAAAVPSSANDTSPTVLRGSPPAAAQAPTAQPAAAQYACPSGYDYDPSYGCVIPGNAYSPYDYGYWPYDGFNDFASGLRHHGFRHGFARGIGARGFASHLGHHVAGGFGQSFARSGRVWPPLRIDPGRWLARAPSERAGGGQWFERRRIAARLRRVSRRLRRPKRTRPKWRDRSIA
jgi:hypothetical protein